MFCVSSSWCRGMVCSVIVTFPIETLSENKGGDKKRFHSFSTLKTISKK